LFLRTGLSLDPFADAAKGDDESVQDGLVHIRIQQRNGRKTLTTIQGLSKEYDLKKIVRACKKVFDLGQKNVDVNIDVFVSNTARHCF
jgi:translation initiation factor SUI1